MNVVILPQDLGLHQRGAVATMHPYVSAAESHANRRDASWPFWIFTITGKLRHEGENVHVNSNIEGQFHQA